MITDCLYSHARTQPDRIFVAHGDQDITYGTMASLVSEFAARLCGQEVRPGNHVAMLCGNRPEFLVAWFAINELGAVAVPLNTGLVGDGLKYTLGQCGAGLLLAEAALYEGKRRDIDDMDVPPRILMIDDAMARPPSRPVPRRQAEDVDPMAAACILYTSGTTGLPKGVVLPHAAYDSAGIDMTQALGLTADDRIMVFLPLFHANPQMYAVTSVLRAGATLVLLPRFSASQFFEDARRHRATGFTFVGTVLSILAKQHPGEQRAHSLRWCVGGGAPERVWRDIERRFGIRVNELYGMTETGGWVTMNTAEATRVGSVGPARAGVALSIRSEAGEVLPAGEKGEITARSDREGVFFTEYWRNPDATAAVLRDGWLHTGDRGCVDEDGYLYFDGRVKDLIRRGGEMIAPAEIEQQLLKHEAIRDCAVAGVPDAIMGEEIKAYIVAARDIDPDELRAFLGSRLPAYMVPRFLSFVEAIPKTETQKIRRHDLATLRAPTIDTDARASARTP